MPNLPPAEPDALIDRAESEKGLIFDSKYL
jgi:hypothetical protein